MKIFKPLLLLSLILSLALGVSAVLMNHQAADAAVTNPPTGNPDFQIITIGPISATTTSITGIWEIKAPWPFRVIGFAGHSGAMANTVTFDLVNSAGTSLLSSALTPTTTAGVVTEATMTTDSSTRNITDETTLQINTATGGNGTTTNTTFTLAIKRL